MFGQTFELHDLLLIGLLIVLEGALSVDNALVLGILARRLPWRLRSKALTYGLIGALIFRLIAVAFAAYLFRWRAIKLLGGLYLVWIAVKHFGWDRRRHSQDLPDKHQAGGSRSSLSPPARVAGESPPLRRLFWTTVGAIELTDIAFAVDSVLAAIALVSADAPSHQVNPKLWVVVAGGMIGVVIMRFAAMGFAKLLERFPRLQTSAYLLVIVIGAKLILDFIFNPSHEQATLHFGNPERLEFWIFWLTMVICLLIGLVPTRGKINDKSESQAPGVGQR